MKNLFSDCFVILNYFFQVSSIHFINWKIIFNQRFRQQRTASFLYQNSLYNFKKSEFLSFDCFLLKLRDHHVHAFTLALTTVSINFTQSCQAVYYLLEYDIIIFLNIINITKKRDSGFFKMKFWNKWLTLSNLLNFSMVFYIEKIFSKLCML